MSNGRMTAILVLLVFLTALQIVLHQHDARRTFVALQALERDRDHLNEEWGRLQLEQSTWATDARVEESARMRLGMQEPDPAAVVLVK